MWRNLIPSAAISRRIAATVLAGSAFRMKNPQPSFLCIRRALSSRLTLVREISADVAVNPTDRHRID
jgi:hypothetical protein